MTESLHHHFTFSYPGVWTLTDILEVSKVVPRQSLRTCPSGVRKRHAKLDQISQHNNPARSHIAAKYVSFSKLGSKITLQAPLPRVHQGTPSSDLGRLSA